MESRWLTLTGYDRLFFFLLFYFILFFSFSLRYFNNIIEQYQGI